MTPSAVAKLVATMKHDEVDVSTQISVGWAHRKEQCLRCKLEAALRQEQAGVSAEARQAAYHDCLTIVRSFKGPIAERIQAAIVSAANDALLATAPPEQASEEYTKEMIEAMEERSKQTKASICEFCGEYAYDCKGHQPQPASDGALDALTKIDMRKHDWDEPVYYVRLSEAKAALASHDQKVREPLATWMIANSFATGHGDTVEDLLKELRWQIEERVQKVLAALQNLLNACVAADAHEELSEFIDGSLLDAARAALAGAVEKK